MLASVSGKFNKSVSVEANRVTVLSLPESSGSSSSSSSLSFEIDANAAIACVEFSPFQPVFALAGEHQVQIHDASNGNLLFTLPVPHSSSVAFSSPTSLLCAHAVEGTVTEHVFGGPATEGEVKKTGSFVGDRKGVSALCFDAHNQLVAAAKNKIYVFDKQQQFKCVSKFTGHDSAVVAMRFLTGGGGGGAELVSCNGKEIYVWPSAVKTRKAVSPLFQLKLESREVGLLQCGPALTKQFSGSVLAVWPGGEARVWQIPSSADGAAAAAGEDANALPGAVNLSGVLAADFCEDGKRMLCLPSSACEELVVAELLSNGQKGGGKKKKQQQQAVVGEIDVLELVGGSSSSKPAAAVKPAEASSAADKPQLRMARLDHSSAAAGVQQTKRLRKDSQVDEYDDRPLLSRLADFSSRLATAPAAALSSSAASSQLAMPATTLSVTLEQALQTEEREKIEAVLQSTDLITATVGKLNVLKLAALLRELHHRFILASSPGRYELLLLWLNSILEQHGEYLASNAECKQMLAEIYKVNEARVMSFAQLFRLKGKLDFTLARCAKQSTALSAASSAQSGPLLVVDGLNGTTNTSSSNSNGEE